jgi:hypothetical protein
MCKMKNKRSNALVNVNMNYYYTLFWNIFKYAIAKFANLMIFNYMLIFIILQNQIIWRKIEKQQIWLL